MTPYTPPTNNHSETLQHLEYAMLAQEEIANLRSELCEAKHIQNEQQQLIHLLNANFEHTMGLFNLSWNPAFNPQHSFQDYTPAVLQEHQQISHIAQRNFHPIDNKQINTPTPPNPLYTNQNIDRIFNIALKKMNKQLLPEGRLNAARRELDFLHDLVNNNTTIKKLEAKARFKIAKLYYLTLSWDDLEAILLPIVKNRVAYSHSHIFKVFTFLGTVFRRFQNNKAANYYHLALELTKCHLDLEDKKIKICDLLAQTYVDANCERKAISVIELELKDARSDEEIAELHHIYAKVYWRIDEIQAAKTHIKEGLRYDPENSDCRNFLKFLETCKA
ncbi:MAG: hypothetical protein K0S74_1373 [Chlamydiales bacterium]|jgi:hypothetical protein|nr:hypothetical protein [Chlamydiales bacterium]